MPRGRRYDDHVFERRVRMQADRQIAVPAVRFGIGKETVEAIVFPKDGIRQSPASPVDGRPMRGAVIDRGGSRAAHRRDACFPVAAWLRIREIARDEIVRRKGQSLAQNRVFKSPQAGRSLRRGVSGEPTAPEIRAVGRAAQHRNAGRHRLLGWQRTAFVRSRGAREHKRSASAAMLSPVTASSRQ